MHTVHGKPHDLGGFVVRRVLPAIGTRMVGPFVFFDHIGPATFSVGSGIDVRPHPHIGLATVTYLFEGEIFHRDSLGSAQAIRPGDINWMTAGRGIVHSERTAPEVRQNPAKLHGIQLWLALPTQHEETGPTFFHHPAPTLPEFEQDGVRFKLLAGTAYGHTSPVATLSSLFYLDAIMSPGSSLKLPTSHTERALYVVDGTVECDSLLLEPGQMQVVPAAVEPRFQSSAGGRVVLLGGAPLDGPRHIFWNFVSSSEKRIEAAKERWKNGDFPKVPGDEVEFIPLPS